MEIIIPSNRPEMAKLTQDGFKEYPSRIFDGSNYPSFSKLINDCILSAEDETVIIANDKVRANDHYIKRMLMWLNAGYGFVGMYHFGFFALTKDLIREIGWFDERYVGGNYEDVDFGRRLLEADIGVYITAEAPYDTSRPSTWKSNQSAEFYTKKWYQTETSWGRKLPDEVYDYDIGPKRKVKWLPFNRSIMAESSAVGHRKLQEFNGKPVDFSGILNAIPNL